MAFAARRAAIVAVAALALWAAPAGAQELTRPPSPTAPPAGYALTADAVTRTAIAVPRVARAVQGRGVTTSVFLRAPRGWQVSFVDSASGREIAQVLVEDRTGRVTGAYTGFRVSWPMARGVDGAFGRAVNHPAIWLTLAVLWALVWLDPRRLRSWRTADALVLGAFSGVYALLNAGDVETGVPLAYPLLAYLLVRLVAAGLAASPRRAAGPGLAWVPLRWLVAVLAALLAGRVVLLALGSNVIDVGRASLLGADRLLDGAAIYGAGGAGIGHPDTYGPVVYLLYAPFQALAGWDGVALAPVAATLAALTWDTLAVAGLAWLGHRLGGTRTAVTFALAWAACPFTALALNSGSNDALVGVALIAALLPVNVDSEAPSAPRSTLAGTIAAVAALTKLAPAAVVPVLATHDRRPRAVAAFAAGFAVVTAALVLLLAGDLGTFADRTLGFQADRGSPFSVWGLYGWDAAQTVAQVAAVAVCLGLALVPRAPGLPATTALAGASLVAVQLAVDHWFVLYLPWVVPLLAVALLAPPRAPSQG